MTLNTLMYNQLAPLGLKRLIHCCRIGMETHAVATQVIAETAVEWCSWCT